MEVKNKIKRYVETSEWKRVGYGIDYEDGFVKWIDSINSGWRNMIKYDRFEKYIEQAETWLSEEDDISYYTDIEEQRDYAVKEYLRCRDNTLYFANKYGYLKEGDVNSGKVKYKAWKAQQILLFLFDSGYNCMIGKARQIGFTTTLGIAAFKRVNFNPSYYVKFITHSKDKGEEIFRDKIRWGFGQIPDWLRQPVYNDTQNKLSLLKKKNKGKTEGSYSMIEVATPDISAINGGSPNLVLIDEIGLFEKFSLMMSEGRPTLFFFNPETQKMEMRRQLFAWGTGGEMEKGGAAFESEFKAALRNWEKRNFEYGIVPLFFDAYARQGMTKEIYEREKKVYYNRGGIDAEKYKVQFHQHYPITIDDMFLRNDRTLLSVNECNKHLNKIYNADPSPQYGYFEPIYDYNQPTGNKDVPYKIVSVQFVPTDGAADHRTTTVIYKHPPKNEKWIYRYFQGTDPINSETGHSKMSSSIWDSYENTVAATLFYRIKDYKQVFAQCLMLGIYYDTEGNGTGVPELIESNIGDMYYDFLEQLGYDERVMSNMDLPKYLQTSKSKWWGINNKTNTAGKIINKLIELLDSYVDNIFIAWFFFQLKTFVEKDLRGGGSSSRQTRFQAQDLRHDYDDVIFSITFAYIAAVCYERYEPRNLTKIEGKKKTQVKYVQSRETNFQLVLAEVDENGKIKRVIKMN